MVFISEEVGKTLNAVTTEKHNFELSVIVKSKLFHYLNVWKGQVNVAQVSEQWEGAGWESMELLAREDKLLNLKFVFSNMNISLFKIWSS